MKKIIFVLSALFMLTFSFLAKAEEECIVDKTTFQQQEAAYLAVWQQQVCASTQSLVVTDFALVPGTTDTYKVFVVVDGVNQVLNVIILEKKKLGQTCGVCDQTTRPEL